MPLSVSRHCKYKLTQFYTFFLVASPAVWSAVGPEHTHWYPLRLAGLTECWHLCHGAQRLPMPSESRFYPLWLFDLSPSISQCPGLVHWCFHSSLEYLSPHHTGICGFWGMSSGVVPRHSQCWGTQVHFMCPTQWGWTNWNVRVWNRERFIARAKQGEWVACTQGSNSLMAFRQVLKIDSVRGQGRGMCAWSAPGPSSDWLVVR